MAASLAMAVTCRRRALRFPAASDAVWASQQGSEEQAPPGVYPT
jgi:hypothetical protein